MLEQENFLHILSTKGQEPMAESLVERPIHYEEVKIQSDLAPVDSALEVALRMFGL
jgi:hypothetical protein